jgi:hypothetical protein
MPFDLAYKQAFKRENQHSSNRRLPKQQTLRGTMTAVVLALDEETETKEKRTRDNSLVIITSDPAYVQRPEAD